jgi:hypothetical protein
MDRSLLVVEEVDPAHVEDAIKKPIPKGQVFGTPADQLDLSPVFSSVAPALPEHPAGNVQPVVLGMVRQESHVAAGADRDLQDSTAGRHVHVLEIPCSDLVIAAMSEESIDFLREIITARDSIRAILSYRF